MNEDRCDQEIFDKGETIAILPWTKYDLNIMVGAAEYQGIRMDWHFAAGRGIVKAMPEDCEKALAFLGDYVK